MKDRILKDSLEEPKASEFELTEEYKVMMDDILEKHHQGKLNYISEEDFCRQTARK